MSTGGNVDAAYKAFLRYKAGEESLFGSKVFEDERVVEGPFVYNTRTGKYLIAYNPSKEEIKTIYDKVKDDPSFPTELKEMMEQETIPNQTKELTGLQKLLLNDFGRIETADGVMYSDDIMAIIKKHTEALTPKKGTVVSDNFLTYKVVDVDEANNKVIVDVYSALSGAVKDSHFEMDIEDNGKMSNWKSHVELSLSRNIEAALAAKANPNILSQVATALPRALDAALATKMNKSQSKIVYTPEVLLVNIGLLTNKVTEITENLLKSSTKSLGIDFKLKRFKTDLSGAIDRITDDEAVAITNAKFQELADIEKNLSNAIKIMNKKRIKTSREDTSKPDEVRGSLSNAKETLKSMYRTLQKHIPSTMEGYANLDPESKSKVNRTLSAGIITLLNQLTIDISTIPLENPTALSAKDIKRILVVKDVLDLVNPLTVLITKYSTEGKDAYAERANKQMEFMRKALDAAIMHQTVRLLNETNSVVDSKGNIKKVSAFGEEPDTVGIKEVNKEIGFLEANLRDAASIDHPILRAMRVFLDDMFYNIQKKYSNKIEEYKSIFDTYKKKHKNYEMFFEKNKSGKKTGMYVRQYTPEFYDLRFKFTRGTITFEEAKDFLDNVEFDKNALTENYEKKKSDYEAYLEEAHDPNDEDELIKRRMNTWNRKNNINEIISTFKDIKTAIEEGDKDRFETLIKDFPLTSGVRLFRRNNVLIPKGEQYKSAQYSAIMKDSDHKKMYETLLNISQEAVSKIGGLRLKSGEKISKYTIARVAHSDYEKFLRNGLLGGLKTLPKMAADLFLATATSSVETDTINAKGERVYSIPAFGYSSDVAIEDLSADLGNTAMLGLLGALNYEVKTEYQPYLELLRDYVMNNPNTKTSKSGDVMKTDAAGDKVLPAQQKIEGSRLGMLLTHTLEKLLYEVDTDTLDLQSSKKFRANDPELVRKREELKKEHEARMESVERSHRVHMSALQARLQEAKEYVEQNEQFATLYASDPHMHKAYKAMANNGKYTLKRIENEISQAETDYMIKKQDLLRIYQEGESTLTGKVISLKKIANSSVSFARLAAIGWSLQSAFFNFLQGISSNWVHSTGKEDYTPTQLLKAVGIATTLKANKEAANKYKSVVNLLDLDDKLFRAKGEGIGGIKKETTTDKILSKLNPYALNSTVEFMNQSTNTIAILIGTKFKNTEGKMVSLWDNIVPNSSGSAFTIRGMPLEEQDQFIKKLGKRIQQVKKITQGNYNEKDPLIINRNWFSKMVTMFKRFFGEAYGVRFEGARYDERLERVVEGRYRSIYTAAWKKGIAVGRYRLALQVLAMNIPIIGRFLNISERLREEAGITDTEIANFRKNAAEFEFIAGTTLGMMSLKETEEEKRRRRKRNKKKGGLEMFILNALERFREDWSIGLLPSQLLRVGNVNLMPFVKAKQFLDAVQQTLFEWDPEKLTYKTGRLKGQNVSVHKWLKFLPITGPFTSAEAMVEQRVDRTK
jgi:hypothetical protein